MPHPANQTPVLVPIVFIPEMERLTKSELIDIAWSFATMCTGHEQPQIVMATLRRERDAVLEARKTP